MLGLWIAFLYFAVHFFSNAGLFLRSLAAIAVASSPCLGAGCSITSFGSSSSFSGLTFPLTVTAIKNFLSRCCQMLNCKGGSEFTVVPFLYDYLGHGTLLAVPCDTLRNSEICRTKVYSMLKENTSQNVQLFSQRFSY